MDLSRLHLRGQNNKLVESSVLQEALRSVLEKEGREDLIVHIKSIKRHEDRVTVTTRKPIINAELSPFSSKISREIYIKAHPFIPEVKKFILQFI